MSDHTKRHDFEVELVHECRRLQQIIIGQQRKIERLERELMRLAEIVCEEDADAIHAVLFCTCPILDGIQVTGSSCPVHGLPSTTL